MSGLTRVSTTVNYPLPRRWAGPRRFFTQSRLNGLGTFLVALVLFLGLFGELQAPYDTTKTNLKERFSPPSMPHWMGTDNFGRDVFSRVIAGARISLQVALIVLSVAVIIGLLVGLIAGFLGGLVDEALMRVTDLFLVFPALVFAAAIATTLGRNLTNTMIAHSIVYWPWYARLIRSQVLTSLLPRRSVSWAWGPNPLHPSGGPC